MNRTNEEQWNKTIIISTVLELLFEKDWIIMSKLLENKTCLITGLFPQYFASLPPDIDTEQVVVNLKKGKIDIDLLLLDYRPEFFLSEPWTEIDTSDFLNLSFFFIQRTASIRQKITFLHSEHQIQVNICSVNICLEKQLDDSCDDYPYWPIIYHQDFVFPRFTEAYFDGTLFSDQPSWSLNWNLDNIENLQEKFTNEKGELSLLRRELLKKFLQDQILKYQEFGFTINNYT